MISLAENCDESGLKWVLVSYDGVNSAWMRLDEPTTEPSVLQEHANLIAKLDEAEGLQDLQSRQPKVGDRVSRIDADGGWWGDFGYFNPTKAVFINGSPVYGTNTGAVEAGGQWGGAYDATPASDRNGIANEAMRQAMTQKPAAPEPPKSQAPDGVFEVAPMGRNPRGWGI